jgi:hypothetical protein
VSRVSISLKSAQALLEVVKSSPWGNKPQAEIRAHGELESAISHATRVRPGLAKAKKEKAAKTRAKGKDTKFIRAAVFARADTTCECGCGKSFTMTTPGELDHFFGRVKVKQSPATTWALRSDCHHFKTLNQPSASWWLQKFVRHAEKHGYGEEFRMAARRLRSIEIQEEGVVS